MKARLLVSQKGAAAFSDPAYKETLSRLRIGYSLSQMRAILSGSDDQVTAVLSRFLDLSVDRGLVVPITTVVNGVVFRAYRHGEDILFGETEHRLCTLAIDQMGQAGNRQTLPHLWVEKLLVLLVRVGLQKGFLHAYNGQLGRSDSAGIRYSLMGPVVQVGTTKLYGYSLENGLTSLLMEQGFLERARDAKDQYRLKSIPLTASHPRSDSEAQQVGALLGKLLTDHNTTGQRLLADDDLIALTSSSSPTDVAGAMAAEVSIFARTWRNAIKEFAGTAAAPSAAKLRQRYDAMRSSNAYYAVNSGMAKYLAFREGKPWHIVNRVANALSDPIHRTTWESWWPKVGPGIASSTNAELRQLVDDLGQWCIEVNAYLRLLNVAIRFAAASDNRESPFDDQAFANDLRDVPKLITQLKPLLGTDEYEALVAYVEDVRQKATRYELDSVALKKDSVDRLGALLGMAEHLLEQVDAMVSTFGRVRPIQRYDNVLQIWLPRHARSERASRQVHAIVRSTQARARQATGKRQSSGTMRFVVIPREAHPGVNGLWITAHGEFARVWLVRLAAEIAAQIPGAEGVLFANLDASERLTQIEYTSQFVGGRFWSRATDILGSAQRRAQFTVYTASERAVVRAISSEVSSARGLSAIRSVVTLTSLTPEEKDVARLDYRVQDPRSKGSPDQRLTTVGIVTILPVETQVVRERLAGLPGYDENQGNVSPRVYYSGVLEKQSQSTRIVLTQSYEPGNGSVGGAVRDLLAEWNPQLVVLLGIAGGIHQDVAIGDVVLATEIYYYERRRERASGTDFRLRAYDIKDWLRGLVNDFLAKQQKSPPEFVCTTQLDMEPFKFFQAPLGCGEAVIKFKKAKVREWLLKVNDKTMAVETEAVGFHRAFQDEQMRHHATVRGCLVLRGISDHADRKKEDRWQRFAADNAMDVTLRLLEHMGDVRRWLPKQKDQ